MPLPRLLTSRDLPEPELAGMRLDGEVYALGDGWCSIDELEGPQHRAAAARGIRSPRFIAELGTAAWVWGALTPPPRIAEFCVDLGARARLRPNPSARVRELVLDPDDRVDFGDGAVTSPLRTAVDLARFRDELSPSEADAIRALAALGGFGSAECEALMDRRRNLPEKRRARSRLREVLG